MTGDMGETPFEYDVMRVSQELHVRPEILNRLVVSFSKSLTQKLQVLEESVFKGDVLKMRSILHEIRGTSGNLRLEDIACSGQVMHEAVKAGKNIDKFPEYFKALKSKAQALAAYAAQQESKNVENPHS